VINSRSEDEIVKRFEQSEIRYLSLADIGKVHPVWKDMELDIPLDSIEPQNLVTMMEKEEGEEWIEWFLISHPIVVIEKQSKKERDLNTPIEYYRLMGHSSWRYITQFIGSKYGAAALKKLTFPVTVLAQKQVASQKQQILSNELVFSFLLQKSKRHRDLMQDYLIESEQFPLSFLNTQSKISRFAKLSKSSLTRTKPDNNSET
jgi:hypothetical protein